MCFLQYERSKCCLHGRSFGELEFRLIDVSWNWRVNSFYLSWMYQYSLIDIIATVAFRKFPISVGACLFYLLWNFFSGTALTSLACKRASIDKIGVLGSLVDKETIHLFSDHFSHDHRVQISQRTLPFPCYKDGMYQWTTKIKAL